MILPPELTGAKPAPIAEAQFSVINRILARPARKFDANKTRLAALRKRLIHPKNCEAIINALPADEGDRMHAVVGGDFVFGDLVSMICQREHVNHLLISTLSMNLRNVETLVENLERGEIGRLELLLSHYFVNNNEKERIRILAAKAKFGPERMATGAARSHTKVNLFEFASGRKLVMESSANLRSSDNVEQISAFCDAVLFDWHKEWLQKLMTKPLTARSRVDEQKKNGNA